MKVEVIVQKCENRYELVINPDIDYDLDFGLFGEGKTVKEAIADFHNSLEEIKEIYKEDNLTFPQGLEFTFKYDLASFLEYYSKMFSYASLERLTGVNQTQLSQYVQGYRKPSKKTSQKIEVALHNFAEELGQVQFV
ncbi:MAG: helix-turn-helix transcriptional regulator [Tenacibaculum sp.]|nr:helix-turn-helix transcriptional regulator [Tenacibaculum sp.]